jgi:hypothetical protein
MRRIGPLLLETKRAVNLVTFTFLAPVPCVCLHINR